MRGLCTRVLVLGLLAGVGQTAAWAAAVEAGAAQAVPDNPQAWTFAVEVYGYFVPSEDFLALPIVRADRGALHLEARYNYEDRGVGSLFAGWTFAFGQEAGLSGTVAPLLGGLFGDTNGVAPAVELELTFGKWEYYLEAEQVFDFSDGSDDFFYAWTELSFYPKDSWRIGLVGQRTRVVDTQAEVSYGLLAGVSIRAVDFSAFYFEPFGEDHFLVLSVGWSF